MKKVPKIFIVVLGYNGIDFIKKCLASVFNLDYPDFSVVLVDNNSRDGSFELAKKNFSKAFFIRNGENLGFAGGVNVGIRFALERMADYVLLLNQDTEVEPDFLKKLIEVGEGDKNIGILSPVIFKLDGKEVWFAGGEIDWLKMKTIHKTQSFPQKFIESSFISGCSMLIKKDVFRKNGLFDDDFFLYYEDADFSLRSLRAGFKNVVVSDSWIYHAEDSNSDKLSKNKLYWLIFSGLMFFYKNTPWEKRGWLKTYVFLRKVKNMKDLLLKKDLEKARIIRRAFRDFKSIAK